MHDVASVKATVAVGGLFAMAGVAEFPRSLERWGRVMSIRTQRSSIEAPKGRSARIRGWRAGVAGSCHGNVAPRARRRFRPAASPLCGYRVGQLWYPPDSQVEVRRADTDVPLDNLYHCTSISNHNGMGACRCRPLCSNRLNGGAAIGTVTTDRMQLVERSRAMNGRLHACLVLAAMAAVPGAVSAQSGASLPLQRGVSVQLAVTSNAVAVPNADEPDALVVALTADGTHISSRRPMSNA